MTYLNISRQRFRAFLVLLLAATVLFPCAGSALADPVSPTDSDRQVALAVSYFLGRDHLLKHPIDDEMSQRCLDSFLELLDPMKVYFYQSDVDAFSQRKNDLDDMVKKGDISFGYDVFKIFLQRVDERVKMVDRLLATKHDFAVDEEMIADADDAKYAKTAEEAFDRWRKRIKYDLLVLKTEEPPVEGQDAIDKLTRRYHSFSKRMHQTDGDELLEMYLTSLTTSFDPHTTYMSPGTLKNFEIVMRLQLEGIGASLQMDDGYTVVRKIIPGGAADKDGRLKLEDKIVAVGQGDDGELVDTVDMKLSNVVKMIRGKKGTKVRLQVVSVDSPERKIIDIIRAKIELKDSEAHGEILEQGKKPDGTPYKIGVIDLPSFYMDMGAAKRGETEYKSTTRDVRKILDGFNEKGVDAVILDLRRNGGGSLTEAINLTGLFIDEGPVVQVKGKPGQNGAARVQPYHDFDPGMAWSGPLAVLTSKFSASASEILAGAIQDYNRGLIVGDHATHGKGTVQSLMDLSQQVFRGLPNAPSMGALKITMQQFYRPSGDSTQNRGVVADIELPSLTTHLDVGESDLDFPIAFDRVEARDFKRNGLVDDTVRNRLQELSDARRSQSEDFKKVLRNIERYKKQKDKKTVTLNEEKFLAERAELNADKEEKKKMEELNDPNRPAIDRNYYLEEALAIMVDYMNLRQVAKTH